MSRRKTIIYYIDGFPAKKCGNCQTIKKLTEFYTNFAVSSGTSTYCKECSKNKWAEGAKNYRTADYRKDSYLKNEYGVSLEWYKEMYASQGGLCAICGRFHEELNIDHNHKTNVIRGLLCDKCNWGLGMLDENPDYFIKAIEYIRKWDIQNG